VPGSWVLGKSGRKGFPTASVCELHTLLPVKTKSLIHQNLQLERNPKMSRAADVERKRRESAQRQRIVVPPPIPKRKKAAGKPNNRDRLIIVFLL
jgi:hypothetical protein